MKTKCLTKILVVGATGLLGPYVVEAFESVGEVIGISRKSYDFTEEDQVKECLAIHRPDCLVLLAAYTDVDGCEINPEVACRANERPALLISEHLSLDSHFIYISTDQVYPDRPGLHSEEYARPGNVYGKSKMNGEVFARLHPKSLVLRTNMFGPSKGRESLSDFFIRLFRSGEELSLYENVLFSPLHMRSIADYLVGFWRLGLTGVFNLGCNEGLSKKDFALEIARVLDLDTSNSKSVLSPELDLRMDVSKIEGVLETYMPTLKQEISKLC